MSTPHIVILGAGYGGIITARNLQRKMNYNEAKVTLVSKHDYHYITTHLHMPAAGTDATKNSHIRIDEILDTQKIEFVKAAVTTIQKDEKKVVLDNGSLMSYDYLVVGLGSNPETFGIAGLHEFAFTKWTINGARLLQNHIEYQFAKYKTEPDHPEYLTFVIGGAGFTGIEFAAELADRTKQLCEEYDIDPKAVKLISIEAAPTALPGFDPELVEYAMKVLQEKGIEFKISTPIKECTPDGVILANGEEIKSATVVWTGGVRGNQIVEQSGFETVRGRVKVNEYLQAPDAPEVFVVGDCSVIFNAGGRPFPPTAQIAMQQGVVCAHNLLASIRNEQKKVFTPEIKGTVASLGKGEAIGIVGSRKLFGGMAAMMKKVVDLRYLFIIGGLSLVLRKGNLFK
jgi:NADH dehydrogenase